MEYKINTLLPIQFEKIENPPYLNDSRFQAVRCYVAHEKENYNGSYFDLSLLEDMGKHMAGVPIVGYISANNINEKDFNGHEDRLLIDKDGVKIEYLGRAYGCVISNDDVTIVDRMHEDGKMRKYLCVTGVLWKMFTDCIDIFDRDISKAHSMELEESSLSGKFEKDGYYHFTSAKIRALCVLGEGILPAMSNSVIEKFSQENINNSIQELLEEVNTSIKQYTKSQQKIDSYFIEKEKAEELVSRADNIFKELGFSCVEWVVDGKENQITGIINKTLNEEASKNWGFNIYDKDTITIFTNDLDKLDTSSISISSVDLLLNKKDNIQNFSLIPKKLEQSDFDINSNGNGGKQNLDEKLELLKKYNLTLEDITFSIDEISLEDLESKLKEEYGKKPEKLFSVTVNQKREALNNALDGSVVKDEEGKIIEETYFYICDFDDSYVYVEKDHWVNGDYDCTYGRYTYTFNNETITATITSDFEQMIRVWLTLEENQKIQDERANYEKLSGDFEEYKNNYSTPNTEVERLKNYESEKLQAERTEQETELFSKYDEILDSEDEAYKAIKETKSDFSIEELESKLAVLYARKNLKFSSNKNNKIIKLGGDGDNTGELSPYGNLFEKHGVNNNKEEK